MATSNAAPSKARKWGLKKGEPVSRNHFSSNIKRNDASYSRLVVRVLEGKNLLASDIETGKSDPVCFCWVGGPEESPNWDVTATNGRGPGALADYQDQPLLRGEDGFDDAAIHAAEIGQNQVLDKDDGAQRVFLSKCCKSTIDPIWNEDVLVPVDISDMNKLINMRCIVSLKDEDAYDGTLTYDDLGQVEIPIKDIIKMGKIIQNAVVLPARVYSLSKSPGMRRVEGTIKLTLSLIIQKEDIQLQYLTNDNNDRVRADNALQDAGEDFPALNNFGIGANVSNVEEYLDQLRALISPPKINTTITGNKQHGQSSPKRLQIPQTTQHVNTADVIDNGLRNLAKTSPAVIVNDSKFASTDYGTKDDNNKFVATMETMMKEIETLKKKIADGSGGNIVSNTSSNVPGSTPGSKSGSRVEASSSIVASNNNSDGGLGGDDTIIKQTHDGISPNNANNDDLDLLLIQPPQGDMLLNDGGDGQSVIEQPNVSDKPIGKSDPSSVVIDSGSISDEKVLSNRSVTNEDMNLGDSVVSQGSKVSRSSKKNTSNSNNNISTSRRESLSSQVDGGDSSVAITGSAASAAKALREMARQRDQLQGLLEDLTKTTKSSLTVLAERLDKMQTSIDAGPPNRFGARSNLKKKVIGGGSVGGNSQSGLRQFKKEQRKQRLDELSESEQYSGNSRGAKDAELIFKSADGSIKTQYIAESDSQDVDANNLGSNTKFNSQLGASANVALGNSSNNNSLLNWSKINTALSAGDYTSAFSYVSSMGELEDLDRLMATTGPVPESLPTTVRNRVYENIAVMLNNDINNERCLVWILALLRGVITTSSHNNISAITTLSQHTLRDIHASLQVLSTEPSKKGLLSQLLGNQIGSYLIGNSVPAVEEEFV